MVSFTCILCRVLAEGSCPPCNELADGLALGGEFHLILCHHISFCHGAVVKIKGTERISDNAAFRTYIRNITMNKGVIQSSAKDEKAQSVYEMYYNYEEPVKKAAGHRILALNRGENEKMLIVKILAPEEQILGYLEKQTIVRDNPYTTPILKEAAADSYSRLIGPSIEREIRSDLTEKAEEGAIKVFGKNLEQLLMQPPIVGRVVLGWDPAFRTGCKLAVVDSTGRVLDTVVIYPTAPQNKVEESRKILKDFIKKYNISLISVGNGTASRESEQIIVDLLKEIREQVQYVIVNEAGASVYSASKLATEEFPAFDVGQRSAVSIVIIMSTARSAPFFFVCTFTRNPWAIYPSSSGNPISPPSSSFSASVPMTGSA